VLDVVGTGADLAAARDAAYGAVARIRMRGGWYRTDIARLPASRTPAET
jgi:phosphoribosylamine--glycine ligase